MSRRLDRRRFITTTALAAGALAAASLPFAGLGSALAQPGARPRRLLPVPLGRGDTVGLVSPSSPVDEAFSLQYAREVLEALGFKVKTGAHYDQRRGHLAGTDLQRAGDLNAMFADRSVKGIVCVRGGAGAARLLPLLDYTAIAANPKVLLGYSDITALHNAIHAQTGLVTFHGPIASGSWTRFNVEQFQRLFFDRQLMEYRNESSDDEELVSRRNRTVTLNAGKASGELVGGNLAVLTGLAGSRYLPDFRGKILFLEDVDEAAHRVDRMFSTLKLMGALDAIAGFVFGQCSDCGPTGNGYGSLTVQQVLEDHIKPLGIPAYSGAMIGHIRDQFILPVGGRVELDADAGTLRMLEPVFQS